MTDMPETIDGKYSGRSGPLFGLALRTGLLTAITLGIYRFWGKTRIRKYIWSSASADGDSLEYTGTGLEKFLGFLVAIVVLAVYLGVVQMVLFYFGLNLMTEPETEAEMLAELVAIGITFLAVVPLIFFAQYRARRYKLARTRWHGIRFGAEKGAWGYSWRAILHWLLTVMSLGILLPRQTFHLEKYMAERSWYGSARLRQHGRWTALYPAMKHLAIGLLILLGALLAGAAAGSPELFMLIGTVGIIWFVIGVISYRVQAFRYLTEHKELEGGITFSAAPQIDTIIGRVILGNLGAGLIAAVAFSILIAVVDGMADAAAGEDGIVPLLVLVAGYVVVVVLYGALMLVWTTQPLIAHIVETLSVENAVALTAIRQREADAGADAEGFADALDLGGAV